MQESRRTVFVLGTLLVLVTLAAYEPLRSNGFIEYDDRDYITGNPHVLGGLSAPGCAWAFQFGYAANWHPLTWLSHMLDVSLFGVDPVRHHAMNLALHCASAVALLVLMMKLTGDVAKSAFVAAAFAVHPLHVESVAWASERKDVLSTLLGFLSLLAWVSWTRKKGARAYAAALALYALGLAAKPMLVTLPFVMLLLDLWPLRRALSARTLVVEKLPFFALSLAMWPVTLLAQSRGGAMADVAQLALSTRLANAISAYAAYLGKALWPADLALFYPYPRSFVAWKVAACALLFAGLTALALLQRRRRPWITVGWLWWAGVLVPVIGVVQAGAQAMADRYTYVALLGLAIAAAYAAGELAERRPSLRMPIAAAAVAVVAAWGVATRAQTRHWKDEVTVFRHAADVTEANFYAYERLGHELLERGELEPALDALQKALAFGSLNAYVWHDIGRAQERKGNLEAATRSYSAAVQLDPSKPEPHVHLANALEAQDRFDEAVVHYERALALAPQMPEAHNDYGVALAKRGRTAEAIRHLSEAVRLRPEFGDACLNLGAAYANAGRFAEAVESLERGIRLQSDRPGARELLERVRREAARTKASPSGR